MRIRSKTFIIISITALAVALVMLSAIKMFLINNLLEQERNILDHNFQSIKIIINSKEISLKSTLLDWSKWDDTYNFIMNHNQKYIDDNLQNSTFTELNLNTMIFVNENGKIIYSQGYNLENQTETPVNPEILSYITKNNNTLSHIGKNIASGILMVSNKPMLILISSITRSDEKLPADGYLLIGQYLDKSYLNYLDQVTQEKIAIKSSKEIRRSNSAVINNITFVTNANTATETALMNDINGNPDIAIIMQIPRKFYNQGVSTLYSFFFVFLFALLIIILTYVLVLDRTVLKRLRMLYSFVEEIRMRKDVRSRIYLDGKDEITSLASAINQMLQEIQTAYKDIQETEERFRLTMEATNDGYWDLRIDVMKLYINSEWLSYVGDENLSTEELYQKYLCTVKKENGTCVNNNIDACIHGDKEYINEEYCVLKKTGERLWVMIRGKIVERDTQGKAIRIVGTFSDITEKKENERELYRLGYTDKLTDLKNRAYMEKVLDEIEQSENLNYAIIMGDINGLKYTNDVFGHQEGDKRLRKTADILRSCCTRDEIIARWGGDEFLILIKDPDKDYIQELINEIKAESGKVSDLYIELSIALGVAVKDNKLSNKDEVIRAAEERMYRNKMLESRSARNSTLISLERTLFEKDQETEEHAVRLRDMCVRIGEAMSFSQSELDELALLAMLHDIGKIGTPDQILMKPDKLTNEEWEIMKKHPEIGYRIAMSTPELVHIADHILSHHERFDGKGYPQGLKGKDISKMARILSVVDSYDVMTHERPYKKAISPAEAVIELKACAGKQFDPKIVDLFIKLIMNG
jgi:diguanylate cyclase (GGDEF)-like protein/PAS domain S-box-containing protein